MILRLILGLTLLFILPIAFIRAQPVHDTPLSDFLTRPERCPAPCFLGVRPRSTTMHQAVALLRANENIAHVWRDGDTLRWRWSAGMNDLYGFQLDEATIVNGLLLPETITLGEVRLALGEPQRITLTANGFRSQSPRVAWLLEYPDRDVHVLAQFQVCSTHQPSMWKIQQIGTPGSSFFVGVGAPDYLGVMPARPVELDAHGWAKQLRDMCHA